MRYINTSEDSITFIDVDGKQLIVPKNKVYTSFNTDTVTFLLIERYDNEGICLFTSRAEDLEINGTTYTFEQLLDGEGISDLFSPTGLSFEVVEELPQSGEDGTIYLVPNEHDTYTEYIWIAEEEKWEEIGDSDIDLSNYYTKSESNNLFATQTVVNEEIAARIAGDGALNTALGTKADKSDTYTKTQVDTALNGKQNALTAGTGITIDANNVISATGGGDYVDVPTFNQKETAIAQALTDLNENKADKTELNTKANAADVYTKSEIDAMIGNIQLILSRI